MPFYSYEMILVGVILLGAMTAGGIKIWLNKRKIPSEQTDYSETSESKNNPI